MNKSSSVVCEPGKAGKLCQWLDERLGLLDLIAFARKKEVPEHRYSSWYFWGGLSLFFFIVQLISGLLLLLYYQSGENAYESVRQITYVIQFGWLIRSAHSWSANLMVFCVFVHMFSVYFMKAYRGPREFGWWTGLGLLGMTMVFGFSGYLLPMDELAYYATKVGLGIPKALGLGPIIDKVVQGGPDVTFVTTQRFFTLHVVILPLGFLGLLTMHLLLVMRHGNAVPPSEELKPLSERRTIPFFPTFLMKDLGWWLFAFTVLTVLIMLFPWQLGPKYDPSGSPPPGIHPEWYFMSQFELLKILGRVFQGNLALLGEIIGIGMVNIGGLLWALVPLFDTKNASPKRAKIATAFGWMALAGLVLLTVLGYVEVAMAGGGH